MIRNQWIVAAGLVAGLILSTGCGSDAFSGAVSGNVQKGPFINGTEITVNELTEELDQTGRSFGATISDDTGSFRVSAVELESGYARVRANGYYFDETSGEISDSPLSLVTLVDFSQADSANINIFGHLQAPRIEYLIQEEGLEFGEARAQAHQEMLDIFYFAAASSATADELDISAAGDDNAMLLAASVIVQSTRSVGELSELLSAIQNDLRDNGELNSSTSASALMNGARTVSATAIRSNLEDRFDALGLSATVSDFETYLEQFIEEAPYEFTGGIGYPSSEEQPNILDPELTQYYSQSWMTGAAPPDYRFVAELPNRTELSIRITLLEDYRDLEETGEEEEEADSARWYLPISGRYGWEVEQVDAQAEVQNFTATDTGEIRIEGFHFTGEGRALMEYFEYGSEEPTRTKMFEWEPIGE